MYTYLSAISVVSSFQGISLVTDPTADHCSSKRAGHFDAAQQFPMLIIAKSYVQLT